MRLKNSFTRVGTISAWFVGVTMLAAAVATALECRVPWLVVLVGALGWCAGQLAARCVEARTKALAPRRRKMAGVAAACAGIAATWFLIGSFVPKPRHTDGLQNEAIFVLSVLLGTLVLVVIHGIRVIRRRSRNSRFEEI